MRPHPLLLLLLLSAGVLAIDNSQNTEYAKLKIKVWRDLSTTAPLTYGILTAYDVPQATPTLDVTSKTVPQRSQYKQDQFGNDYLETRWLENERLDYRVDFTLESRATQNNLTNPPPFPLPKKTSDAAKEYLQPSFYAPITPAIEAKALEITQGSKDSFEAVARLAFWLHNNIEYDAKYGPVIMSASWVLENHKGVCDEYSHAFIAMARAVGIPARYVSGIAYGKSTLAEVSWQNHAWAEVYLGQWVPVDPTWGEIGYVDATHIKLAVGMDSKDLETKFEWMPDSAKVQLSEIKYSVQELEYRNFSAPPAKFSASADSGTLGIGSTFRIASTLKNNAKGCIGEEAKLTVYSDPAGNPGKSFSIEYGEAPLLIVTCPGQEKKADWIIKTPPALDAGYDYTYDAIAYDLFSESRLKISVDPRISDKPTLKVSADRTILAPGESATVTVDVENNVIYTIDSIRLYAGEDALEQKTELTPGNTGSATFTVKPAKAGPLKIVAYSPQNSASVQVMAIASRAISITNLTLPDTIAPGGQATATAIIENNASIEKTLKITTYLGPSPIAEQYLTLKPKESKQAEVQFLIPPTQQLGNYRITLRVASNDEKYADVLVYENKRPEITPTEPGYFSGVGLKIKMKARNTAQIPITDLNATVAGGEPKALGNLEPGAEATLTYKASFDSPGTKDIPVHLEYQDQFKTHSEDYMITVTATEPTFFEKIKYYITQAINSIIYERGSE